MDPSAIASRDDILLGKLLVDAEFLTRDQLYDCVELQKMYGDGRPIGRVFVEMGYVAEAELEAVLEIQAEYLEDLELHGWRETKSDPGGAKAAPSSLKGKPGGPQAPAKPNDRAPAKPATPAPKKTSAAPAAPKAKRKPARDLAADLAAVVPVSDRDATLLPDAEGDATYLPSRVEEEKLPYAPTDDEWEDTSPAAETEEEADAPADDDEFAEEEAADEESAAEPAGDAPPAEVLGSSSISGFYTYKVKGIRAAPLAGGQRIELAGSGGWFSYLLEKAIAVAVVGMAVVMVLLVVLFIRDRFAEEPEAVVVEPRKVRRTEDPAPRNAPLPPEDPVAIGIGEAPDPETAAPPSIPPADVRSGALEGLALQPDGAPLAELAVTITDAEGGGLAAVTGADGAFRLDRLPPGSYTVSVRSPQNIGRLPEGAYDDRSVFVEAGQTARVEFRGTGVAHAALLGHVSEQGHAVAGAYVTLVFLGGTGETGPGGEGIDTKSLATDANGQYRFGELAPGSYTILATHPTDPSRVARAVIDLPDGGERRKDLQFSNLVLRGRVVDGGTAAPLPGVSVFLHRDDPASDPARVLEALVSLQVMSTFTDENGAFDFASMEPGTYVVVGSLEGYATRALPRVTLADTAGVQEVVVELHPGGAVLEGTVKKKSGSIPPNTYVAIRDAAENVISLRRVDRNGEFEVDGLAPGAYRAVIFCEGEAGQERFFTVAAGGVMSQEFEIP